MSAKDPRRALDHPENDLFAASDSYNLQRPAPRTIEELADGPDPAHQAALNRASTKQALAFLTGTVVLSIAIAFGLALAFRLTGGPRCDAGEAVWLCTQTQQLWWAGISSIVPIAGAVGCAIIMVKKLRSYTRWSSWMGIFWALVPHCMAWLLATILVFVDATS